VINILFIILKRKPHVVVSVDRVEGMQAGGVCRFVVWCCLRI